jgi:hypothetical protein
MADTPTLDHPTFAIVKERFGDKTLQGCGRALF